MSRYARNPRYRTHNPLFRGSSQRLGPASPDASPDGPPQSAVLRRRNSRHSLVMAAASEEGRPGWHRLQVTSADGDVVSAEVKHWDHGDNTVLWDISGFKNVVDKAGSYSTLSEWLKQFRTLVLALGVRGRLFFLLFLQTGGRRKWEQYVRRKRIGKEHFVRGGYLWAAAQHAKAYFRNKKLCA